MGGRGVWVCLILPKGGGGGVGYIEYIQLGGWKGG